MGPVANGHARTPGVKNPDAGHAYTPAAHGYYDNCPSSKFLGQLIA